MNLFYDILPTDIQDFILKEKRRLELYDVHAQLKKTFYIAGDMVDRRRQYVHSNQFEFQKIQAFDLYCLKKANKFKERVLPLVYRVQTKWKRFYGDKLYKSLRNPWNYSWVTDLSLLTMVELRIHCRNNNLSASGDKQLLIQRLLSI